MFLETRLTPIQLVYNFQLINSQRCLHTSKVRRIPSLYKLLRNSNVVRLAQTFFMSLSPINVPKLTHALKEMHDFYLPSQ